MGEILHQDNDSRYLTTSQENFKESHVTLLSKQVIISWFPIWLLCIFIFSSPDLFNAGMAILMNDASNFTHLSLSL